MAPVTHPPFPSRDSPTFPPPKGGAGIAGWTGVPESGHFGNRGMVRGNARRARRFI